MSTSSAQNLFVGDKHLRGGLLSTTSQGRIKVSEDITIDGGDISGVTSISGSGSGGIAGTESGMYATDGAGVPITDNAASNVGTGSLGTTPLQIHTVYGGRESSSLGADAVVIGTLATITGGNTVAIGSSAKGLANSVVIGTSADSSTVSGCVTLGFLAGSTGTQSVAIGQSASVVMEAGIAIGLSATVRTGGSTGAIAIGKDSKGYNGCVAVGQGAEADFLGTTAVGFLAGAGGNNTTAIGHSATTTGHSNTLLGASTSCGNLTLNTAIGAFAVATGGTATAIGHGSTADAGFSTALGQSSSATAVEAIAIGYNASATHQGSVVLGSGSLVSTAVNSLVATRRAAITPIANDILAVWRGNELYASNVAASYRRTTSEIALNLGATPVVPVGPAVITTERVFEENSVFHVILSGNMSFTTTVAGTYSFAYTANTPGSVNFAAVTDVIGSVSVLGGSGTLGATVGQNAISIDVDVGIGTYTVQWSAQYFV